VSPYCIKPIDNITFKIYTEQYAPIAQLVEQQTFNLRVEGSKPSGGTIDNLVNKLYDSTMANTYDIPDPFLEFVEKKYKNFSGMKYHFFDKFWSTKCGACNTELDGPNKKTLVKIRLFHTRNECLNGY
jgi:hypothetical protein